jgi:hypothetical protein
MLSSVMKLCNQLGGWFLTYLTKSQSYDQELQRQRRAFKILRRRQLTPRRKFAPTQRWRPAQLAPRRCVGTNFAVKKLTSALYEFSTPRVA